MKGRTLYLISILLLLLSLTFQCCQNINSANKDVGDDIRYEIIKGNGSLHFGVTYYPEQRTPSQWLSDFKTLKEAGVERIRIGEFAWSRLEPNMNEYNWYWLDKCIELAGKNNLEVVFCTPVAVPPIWLVSEYPDVLPVDEKGQKALFGTRHCMCFGSPGYKKHAGKIVELILDRYGKNPNINAWQIDNKACGEHVQCFCELCADKFQQYLANKYGTIEELNKRWGNAFRSMDYQSFEQINPPFKNQETNKFKHHPSLEMEYLRFSSQNMMEFCEFQASIIRKNTGSPIITNHIVYNGEDSFNACYLNLSINAAGVDLNNSQLHHIAFYADLNRSLNPSKTWVMDFGVDTRKLEHELNVIHSRGIEWVYFKDFNARPWGQGQSLSSLTTVTGNPTKNLEVISRFRKKQNQDSIIISRSKIGLYYDIESSRAYFNEVLGDCYKHKIYQNYFINTVYKAFFESSDEAIQIYFSPTQKFNVEVLVLPMQIIHCERLENNMLKFLNSGGTVIVTDDLFQKNKDNVYLTQLPKSYKSALNINDNFVEPADSENIKIIEHNVNEGKIIMVNKLATLENWKELANSFN